MTPRVLVLALALCAGSPAVAEPTDPPGATVYQDAIDAYLGADYDTAMTLAMRAVALPGPHKTAAKFLYGDTLFRTGQYQRAKDIYLLLRRQVIGTERATAEKKVIATNRALKLSERDGLDALPVTTVSAPTTAVTVTVTPPAPATTTDTYAHAIDAYRAGDLEGARTLAAKAAAENTVHRIDAKVLYADILARGGEYARAKQVLVGLRARTGGDVRIIVTRKIVELNRRLKLPDTDGVGE